MSTIGKGHLAAIGGVDREELETKMTQRRKAYKPKIELGSGIPGPEETIVEKKEKIEEKSVEPEKPEPKDETSQVQAQKIELEPIEEKTPRLAIDDDFDYMKKRKPKSETHVQITVRIPKELNKEVDKIASKMYKGWKQEFITAALTKEIQKIKSIDDKKS